MWTGRGASTYFVEFDADAAELHQVGGLKRLFGLGRYQQFLPEVVDLPNRNPAWGQLASNRGQWFFFMILLMFVMIPVAVLYALSVRR